MQLNIKRQFLSIICLMLCLGQSSFADEPIADWHKMIAPNYVQFQKVHGEKLDGTVFSQMFRPANEQVFSDKQLTSEQINLGAELSEQAYSHCMAWGYHRLTAMYGDNDVDKIADDILQLCQDHENIYSIYNMLLASDYYGFEMTEYKAWQRILENAKKNKQYNIDFHQAVRKRVRQMKEYYSRTN